MNPTKYHKEGEILFMSSINFLLFPDGTWPVIGEGISYQRTLTPLPTTSNNEHDKKKVLCFGALRLGVLLFFLFFILCYIWLF